MAKPRGKKKPSLASLARSLDTSKRVLPGDAPPAAPRREAARPASTSRADALKSMARAPSPAPRKVPVPVKLPVTAKQAPPSVTPASTSDARRRYPRADISVRARLQLDGDETRFFEATLATTNISVGGIFFESTFFLKMGTLLLVELTLPPDGRTVRARGEVVRIETQEGISGFAVRFTEYLDGSEVVLATHFLSPVLKEFLAVYARQHKFTASAEYIAHTADVLAAWELRKAELGSDVWTLVGSP